VGPGDGGGEGRIRAPTTDFLLIPPDAPRNLRGRQIKLAVDIDERGNVTDARVVTSSGDRRYDGQVVRRAKEWKFNPAREVATNRAVAVRDFPLEFDI
jgi:TonB family protein